MATRFELEELAREHNFLGASHDRNARRTLWVVALTAVMMVGEIAAGLITGSMALIADGFHMATHAGALAVAAAAYSFAKRHVGNPRFTFGTGKVGDLAGFASALVLGGFAIGIAAESALRLVSPVHVDFSSAIVIAVLGLMVNLVSAAMLSHGHEHRHAQGNDSHEHQHDHEQHDHNFRAAYVHVLADAFTSVLAILALVAGRYLGLVWLDPAIGVVGALVIARWSWTLLVQTSAVLLDTADRRLLERMKSAVEEGGAVTITDLHVWRIGPDAHAAIVCASGPESVDNIHRRLSSIGGLVHVTVEVRSR
jgi:cation diffusion facilitator family transporter